MHTLMDFEIDLCCYVQVFDLITTLSGTAPDALISIDAVQHDEEQTLTVIHYVSENG